MKKKERRKKIAPWVFTADVLFSLLEQNGENEYFYCFHVFFHSDVATLD